MTYQESDLDDFISQIESLIDRPLSARLRLKLVEQAIDIYRDVPLYPGIAAMLSADLLEDVDVDQLNTGDYLSVTVDGDDVCGPLTDINEQELTIEASNNEDQRTVAADAISDLQRINTDALKQEWPELHFDNSDESDEVQT